MALYAFDGTWDTAKEGDDPEYDNTNVVRFYRTYSARSGTRDFYVEGVGTRFDLAGRIIGGLFGAGTQTRIKEAYDHLCENWLNGDRVIDIIGFSRGAATTLDFCHHIQDRGIREPDTDRMVERDPEIRFLGVWDIVAAFGLANTGNTVLNIGHHLHLPKSGLKYCFHALALDERRIPFLPIRVDGAHEVWFRGAHGDVGGGNGNRGLNDISMRWMMSKAIAAGLPLTGDDVIALQPDPGATPKPARKLKLDVRLVGAVDRQHYTVAPVDGWKVPPATSLVESESDEQTANEIGAAGIEVLPLDVQRRVAAMWEAALGTATAEGFSLDEIKDALLSLFQGRVPLVTNDDDLKRARQAAADLIAVTIRGARQRGYTTSLPEFFLTEALSKLPRFYPFTD